MHIRARFLFLAFRATGTVARFFLAAALGLVLAAWATAALAREAATESASDPWAPLVQALAREGLDPAALAALFARPEAVYDPDPLSNKLHALFERVFGHERTKALQRDLKTLGLDPGPVDGAFGNATAQALREFQQSRGLRVDGVPLSHVADLAHVEAEAARGREYRPGDPETRLSANVYRNVMKPARLAEGLEFYIQHRSLLRRMEARYGVPGQVAAGIVTVETRAGRYLGVRPALATLASMALGSDFDLARSLFDSQTLCPEQEAWLQETAQARAGWALAEAAALLEYADQAGVDPLALPGSPYGAVGVSQFMPSSALAWGVDGDGDGRVDLFTVEDAVMSLANYLKEHGWETGGVDASRRALFRYNHSHRYVNTVLAVAGHVSRAEPELPERDGLQELVVSDAASLFQALGPERRISLEPGVYDLTAAVRENSNAHVRLVQEEGAQWVEIADLSGLVLTSRTGATLLGGLALARADNVLLDNVTLSQNNATQVMGPVLRLDQCTGVRGHDLALLGNGGPGLAVRDSRDLTLVNTMITACNGTAMELRESNRVLVANGLFLANSGERMIDVTDSSGVQFIGCVLRDNQSPEGHLLHLDPGSGVALLETFLGGNAALGLTNLDDALVSQGLETAANTFGP